MNMNLWGNNVQTYTLINALAGTSFTNSNNLSLYGAWSEANQVMTFTGYQDCSSNCVIHNFSSSTSKSLADLIALGFTGVNGWINGVNVNYSFNISNWVSNAYVPVPVSAIKLVKQTSKVVAPTDDTVPTSLACIGNCPSIASGALVDVNPNTWPPLVASKVNVSWNPAQGAPSITVGGVTKAIDWSGSAGANNGHWYQLFDSADLSNMLCDAWDGHANVVNGGYCTNKITEQANSVYYTWQSGNQWDAFNYLVYRSGANAGKAVQPNPPLSLSFTVPNAQGNLPAYIGKTITVQSPYAGNLWLPGNCVDATGAEAPCTGSTDWVNSVSVPTATDGTGSLTLLDAAGRATSTQYYAKWLKRGVYFATLPSSSCAPLAGQLAQAQSVALPGVDAWNTGVKAIGLPWPTAPFDGKPRVVDGALQ